MLKFALVFIYFVTVNAASIGSRSNSKIVPFLQKVLLTKSHVNILISMREGTQSVLSQVTRATYANREEQATAVYKALNTHAAQSQSSVLAMLSSPRTFVASVKSFWITNQIYVQGADAKLIQNLAAMDEVSKIEEEQIYQLENPIASDVQQNGEGIFSEWGIEKIEAEAAWAAGSNGAGAVVGITDSGARYTHEAINGSYRGGTNAWYNPYTLTEIPEDGHGHGTHVTGTIVGLNGIGVAPGAKWISCKGFKDNGSATQAGLIACGQFHICPHTYNGDKPDCKLTPHVVSNSWTSTGYDDIIRAWHAVNIVPVFALGNSGSSCSSSNHPGDSDAGVLGVGATSVDDSIATFSSRGPAPSGAQKPDISAPGNNIRSAGHQSDSTYVNMSGTSMACPHVAGLVALLKGKRPGLTFDQIRNVLRNTADRNLTFSNQTCAGVPDTQFPNYSFGYGRVNALRAVSAI